MLDEVRNKLPCGLAEQWRTTELSAEMMHLAVDYTIFTLGYLAPSQCGELVVVVLPVWAWHPSCRIAHSTIHADIA